MLLNTGKPLYLIDASIYIFRAYFSMPDRWFSPSGYSVNALYGYCHFLLKFLSSNRPESIAAAFDESLGSCFRNDIYPAYKSSRVLPDPELAYQLSACQSLTELLGLQSVASERYEADDIIASFAAIARNRNQAVCILTHDKDLGQLLQSDSDWLWDYAKDRKLDRRAYREHYGLEPGQLLDYLALMGDSVDDVPGVPGIGEKTAKQLLITFGSISAIYADLDAVTASSIRGAAKLSEHLHEYREQIAMAQQLVLLEEQVPGLKSKDLQWAPPNRQELEYFLKAFGLGNSFQSTMDRCDWLL